MHKHEINTIIDYAHCKHACATPMPPNSKRCINEITTHTDILTTIKFPTKTQQQCHTTQNLHN
jgi:hypothetical protein